MRKWASELKCDGKKLVGEKNMLVHTGKNWKEEKSESTVGEISDCDCDDGSGGGDDNYYDYNDSRFVSVNILTSENFPSPLFSEIYLFVWFVSYFNVCSLELQT